MAEPHGLDDAARNEQHHQSDRDAIHDEPQIADAAKEFKIVVDKYPSNELAKKAKDYLKILGVPVSQAPAQKKRQ